MRRRRGSGGGDGMIEGYPIEEACSSSLLPVLICKDPRRWRDLVMACGGDFSLLRSSSVRVRGRGCDPKAVPLDVSCRSLLCADSMDGVWVRRGGPDRGDSFWRDMGDADSDSESDRSTVVLMGTSGLIARIVRSLKSSG